MSLPHRDKSGAYNLLRNCIGVRPGNKVLLVCEDPIFGWYDEDVSTLLAEAVRDTDARVTTAIVGSPDRELPGDYARLIDEHDTIIYLARIGDQDRFTDNLPGKKVAMLYTRDVAALSSSYASINHLAMKEFKTAVDQVSMTADIITITCPLGTELECRLDDADRQLDGEVTIERFPLCVPQPIPAKRMNGKVALSRWLTLTGSRSYSPASCKIDSVVHAEIEQGKIVDLKGEPACVAAIEAHYEFVSRKFQIEKKVVHSWHAGIHPACFYSGNIDEDPDRWSNNVFGSPRFVHFHTCGNYPPGEICWMVLDPTIGLDGVQLWHNGRLMIENFTETSKVVREQPVLQELFSENAAPKSIGI